MEKKTVESQKQRGSSRKVLFFSRDKNDKMNEKTVELPIEYLPDLKDKNFRCTTFFTEEKSDAFHSLGKGSQADVLAGVFQKDPKESPIKVAIKRYQIGTFRDFQSSYTNLLREIRNTQFHAHPNIVTMISCFHQSFIDKEKEMAFVYLVTERMDCSLEYYFKILFRKKEPRDHRHLASLLVQVFRALDYLNRRGIMHRDLAPKNIGMNQQSFVIKLLDFGTSGHEKANRRDVTLLSQTPPNYQPLEVILEIGYDCKVDVWAAGLVAVEMLGKKLMLPINESTVTSSEGNEKTDTLTAKQKAEMVKERILNVVGLPTDRYEFIFKGALKNEAIREPTLDKELATLTQRALDQDRQPSLNKPSLIDLLKKIFVVNPLERPSPEQCLEHPYLSLMNQKLPLQVVREKNDEDKEALEKFLEKFSDHYLIER